MSYWCSVADELESSNPHTIAGHKVNIECKDEPINATDVLIMTGLPENVHEFEISYYMDYLTNCDSETEDYLKSEIHHLPKGTVAKIKFSTELGKYITI